MRNKELEKFSVLIYSILSWWFYAATILCFCFSRSILSLHCKNGFSMILFNNHAADSDVMMQIRNMKLPSLSI